MQLCEGCSLPNNTIRGPILETKLLVEEEKEGFLVAHDGSGTRLVFQPSFPASSSISSSFQPTSTGRLARFSPEVHIVTQNTSGWPSGRSWHEIQKYPNQEEREYLRGVINNSLVITRRQKQEFGCNWRGQFDPICL